MYVNVPRRIVYLATPRTASRATVGLLQREFGFLPYGETRARNMASPPGGHHKPLQRGFDPDDWRIVTTVRNHFDLFVSWWRYVWPAGQLPLDEKRVRWLWRHSPYFPVAGRAFGLHLGPGVRPLRYESLDADLSDLLGVSVTPAVFGATRRDRDWRQYIDGPTRSFIEAEYGAEMADLGYSWDRG